MSSYYKKHDDTIFFYLRFALAFTALTARTLALRETLTLLERRRIILFLVFKVVN